VNGPRDTMIRRRFADFTRNQSTNDRHVTMRRTFAALAARFLQTIPFSSLTSRWRFDLPGGSEFQYRLMARETNAVTISTWPFVCAPLPARGHGDPFSPRPSRDLIPGTHLLDWGRTNFSISRQLGGCDGVERRERPSPADARRNFSTMPYCIAPVFFK
jgi:hypothetical protein